MEEVGWLVLPLAPTNPDLSSLVDHTFTITTGGDNLTLALTPVPLQIPEKNQTTAQISVQIATSPHITTPPQPHVSPPTDPAWTLSAVNAVREAAKYSAAFNFHLKARIEVDKPVGNDGATVTGRGAIVVALCCDFRDAQQGPKGFTLTSVYGEIKREAMTRWKCDECCPTPRVALADSQICSNLCGLSVDILQVCCLFLSPCSIGQARGACRYLFEKLQPFVPGFRLRLHVHQELALEWMEQREQEPQASSFVCTKCGYNLQAWNANPRYHLLQAAGSNGGKKALCLDLLTGRVFGRIDTVQLGHVRGGLLCDEPGLGKTVTLIALLLKTFRKYPKPFTMTDEAVEKHYLNAAGEGWLEWDVIYRRQAMARVLSALRKRKENDWFHYPVDTKRVPDYKSIISAPIDMQTIGRRLEKGEYDSSLDLFEAALKLCYSNAKEYNPSDHPIYRDAELMELFMRRQVKELRRNAGIYACRHAEDDLAELQGKTKLIVSSGTLLVVPLALMNHWKEQLVKAVNMGFLGGTLNDHVYMDTSGSKALPNAIELARYWIVIVPTRRASVEYSKAVDSSASTSTDPGAGTVYVSPLLEVFWLRLVVDEGHTMGSTSTTNLARFLREIHAERSWVLSGTPTKDVDLKTSLKTLSGLLRYMRHPAFGEAKRGDVSSFQAWRSLVSSPFLDKKATGYWRLKGILRSLMAKTSKADVHIPKPIRKLTKLTMSAFERKYYNLRCAFIMTNVVLTVKLDGRIQEESLLHASQRREAAMQMRNIRLMCSGGGRLVCSITDLNRELTRRMLASSPCPNPVCRERHAWRHNPEGFHARGAVDNREVCLKHGASGFGKPDSVVQRVDRFIGRTITGRTTLCGSCGIDLELLIVLPCGCFFCFECIKGNYLQCSVCHSNHTFDEIQLLQPGFSIDWHESLLEAIADARDRATARNSSNLVVSRGALEAPRDGLVQEWQGGVKSRHIYNRLISLRESSHSPKVIVFSQFAQALNLVGHDLILRFGQDAVAEFSGKYRSAELDKFKYNRAATWMCTRCGLKNQQADSKCKGLEAKLKLEAEGALPEQEMWVRWDLITGYQLGRQYRLGEQVLYGTRIGVILSNRRCGCSRFGSRQHEAAKITVETVDCFVLLLGVDGSHGLDLSFVSHIFLLDKIWNPSLEKQVVARAYRMGSTASVEIETLIMKDTIEDLMLSLEQDEQQPTDDSNTVQTLKGLADQTLSKQETPGQVQQPFQVAEMRKLHYLLRRIRLVRDDPEKKHERNERGSNREGSSKRKRIRFNV